MTLRLAAVLLTALLCVDAAAASHPEQSRNPDRWPTVDLSESGSSSFKGDQISFGAASETENDLRNLTVATPLLVILPLADPFTLTLGAGASWTEQDTVGSATTGATAASNSQGTYLLSGRWYFENGDARVSRPGDNPDQWPSLALSVSGASTYHYSNTNANGDTNFKFKSDNVNAALDARLPVADAWTLLASVGTGRSCARSDPTATATGATLSNGVLSRVDALTGSLGFRYYLVGRNPIKDDQDLNPDRWVMLGLNLSTSQTLRGRQTVSNVAGVYADRESSTRLYGATATARVPVTNHVSLHFDLTGGYTRNATGRVAPPAQPGNLARFASLGFQAGLRYFFF